MLRLPKCKSKSGELDHHHLPLEKGGNPSEFPQRMTSRRKNRRNQKRTVPTGAQRPILNVRPGMAQHGCKTTRWRPTRPATGSGNRRNGYPKRSNTIRLDPAPAQQRRHNLQEPSIILASPVRGQMAKTRTIATIATIANRHELLHLNYCNY